MTHLAHVNLPSRPGATALWGSEKRIEAGGLWGGAGSTPMTFRITRADPN